MQVGTIDFSQLLEVDIHEREVNGEMVECISIPMKLNGIRWVKGRKIIMQFTITPKKPNPYGQTAFLSLRYPAILKDVWEKVNAAGWDKQIKFIGNVMRYGKTNFYSTSDKVTDLDSALNNEG